MPGKSTKTNTGLLQMRNEEVGACLVGPCSRMGRVLGPTREVFRGLYGADLVKVKFRSQREVGEGC